MTPPSDPSVLFAAAQALHKAGRAAEAKERCDRLLAQTPYHGGALYMLGAIAFRAGEKAEGARRFSEAASLALAQGDADTALQRAVEAVSADETPETRRLFAAIAGSLRFAQDDPVVRPLLARALGEDWGPLAPLASAAAGLMQGRLQDDALLRAALAAAPITDAALETALTAARRKLLESGGDAGFAAALAQQCFLNGYVFAQSEDETARVRALRARAKAGAVSDAELAALACYVPLHEVAGVEKIAAAGALAALLKQQRDEPAEEKTLAAAMPALTPVGADAGDGEPWPRWSGTPAAETPMTLREYLALRFPLADVVSVPENPAMLAAGCGTAQYALHLARALTLESVTAIDLSRANLAFAARKAAGMAVTFGQGDILQASALDRRFGLIECGGVLHQLSDPLAGWSALLGVLEPNGVMRLAVHSATARAALAPIRQLLAKRGFDAGDDGIRAARRWLAGRKEVGAVRHAPEFFTMGGCRHLLFPGAEHPLTLPQIAGFLRRNGLALIGLDVAPATLAAYRARFPGDAAATDLDNWAAFEQENPQSFAAMVQFWVRKQG